MTGSRWPSRVMSAPVVVLMRRMLHPEALDGARLVGMDFDEVLSAGQRQHGFDALLNARELQMASAAAHLTIEIHQAADRGAVDIGDRREVDDDVVAASRDERRHGPGEVPEHGVHDARFGGSCPSAWRNHATRSRCSSATKGPPSSDARTSSAALTSRLMVSRSLRTLR